MAHGLTATLHFGTAPLKGVGCNKPSVWLELTTGDWAALEATPLTLTVQPAATQPLGWGGAGGPGGTHVAFPHTLLLRHQGYTAPAAPVDLTPEMVWGAYQSTGLLPANRAWWTTVSDGQSRRYGTCGLMALALQAAGFRQAEWPDMPPQAFLAGFLQDRPLTRLSALVPVTLPYVDGFLDGFDERVSVPAADLDAPGLSDYQRGHAAGRAAWAFCQAQLQTVNAPPPRPLAEVAAPVVVPGLPAVAEGRAPEMWPGQVMSPPPAT